MRDGRSIVSDVSVILAGVMFMLGLFVLGVRLYDIQVRQSAAYNYAGDRQSERRVQTDGARGRITDRKGRLLAGNRSSRSIVVNAAFFQSRTWEGTVSALSNAIEKVSAVVGKPSPLNVAAIRRHVNQRLAMPLVVWRDADDRMVARFCERSDEFPGFDCRESLERFYPNGPLAAHVLGYVGRGRNNVDTGDEKFNFYHDEVCGRSGVEEFYDGFLRGVSGEDRMVVDARGFVVREWTVLAPKRGPDIRLTLDIDIQKAVERELQGVRGACVVLDPRDGAVLAMASAPSFDPNAFVPIIRQEVYDGLRDDSQKPLLNRAVSGAYAPGSTFKPVTSLAALRLGISAQETYECVGVYSMGGMRLHCTRRWGHGELNLTDGLRVSCNPFFCNLGAKVGTNALICAAHDLGFGAKTGIDLPRYVDMAGIVPEGVWKQRMYGERWYPGDLIQMSIGQGMLLASPLQMARLAGAIGTGRLVTPFLNASVPHAAPKSVPFAAADLAVVRRGMIAVVADGTGRRGGDGVKTTVAGKTGTAEVGRGATRRKNTWFIAFAPAEAPEVAVAMVIENGDSGGVTTAPRVRNVLASIFGEES